MSFTRHATDFISEKIDQVTKCGATDVAKEFPTSAAWVSTFGLCVILQDHPPAQNRQHELQFVRRVEMAFAEYSRASTHLSDLVSGGLGRWSPYFRALYHFEAAISQLYLAYDGARKKLGNDYFANGDGSDLDRINKIYNACKHQIASTEQTLWITDDGVCADGTSISFVEIEQLLRSYARIANRTRTKSLRPKLPNNSMQPTALRAATDAERSADRRRRTGCKTAIKKAVRAFPGERQGMGSNLLLTNFCLHLSHLLLEAFACGLLLQPAHQTLNNRFGPCPTPPLNRNVRRYTAISDLLL